ncbi:hypothetical protein EZJ28_12555 [Gramella sp. KN1008]|nr:hypothetical protein EZJ28_12555 [Gramella sp. KN1008]
MSLFRRTRRWLLNQNKFGRYLLYAIGEVILIVIGILIALGINNWNQRRITQEREQFYLAGLKEEFLQSRIKLENLIQVNRLNYEGARKIADYINGPGQRPGERELSGLLFNSLSYEIDYNPNNSLLNELINSGRLKDFSNAQLGKNLTSWESYIQSVHRQESDLREQREKMLDFLRKEQNSIRNILDETGVSDEIGLEQSADDHSNLGILDSGEFENNLLIYILTGMRTETSQYLPLLEEIDRILVLIDSGLENNDGEINFN